MATNRICSIPECGKAATALGLCPMHRWRLKHKGTTELAPRITACTISECGKKVVANGLCERHYRRIKANGHPDLLPRVSRRPKCAVDGCEKTSHGLGLCQSHYSKQRQRRKQISTARHGEGLAFLDSALQMQTDECILWPFGSSRGYGVTYINQRNVFAHRYVCEKAHGPPPFTEAQAAHACGTRTCVNSRHIRWATAKENTNDKRGHGTLARGEKIANSKLKEHEVVEILTSPERNSAMAKRFGVDINTVRNIRNRKSWAHVEPG